MYVYTQNLSTVKISREEKKKTFVRKFTKSFYIHYFIYASHKL